MDGMTPKAQKIAIAKILGWTVQFNETKDLYELINPQGKWEHPYDADGDEEHCWRYVPDLLSKFNAVRKAVLEYIMAKSRIGDNNSLFVQYVNHLKNICGPCKMEGDITSITVFEAFAYAIEATPPQRWEAFLKTFGKWEES
jgi:hypothetical protein